MAFWDLLVHINEQANPYSLTVYVYMLKELIWESGHFFWAYFLLYEMGLTSRSLYAHPETCTSLQ